MGQPARDELEQRAAALDLTKWPGQVVNLYLGRAAAASVLAAASNADQKNVQEQLCEAYFFRPVAFYSKR